MAFQPGQVVELDDPLSVGRVSEFETQDLSVVLRLLESGTRRLVRGLRLDHRDREVPRVLQEVVRTFLGSPAGFRACHHDTAVRKRALLRNRVWRLVPTRLQKLWNYILTTGVGLGDDLAILY